MNRSFWLGTGIGAVVAVIVCSVMLNLRNEPAAAQAPRPTPSPSPSAAVPDSAALERQFAQLKEEASAARREADRWKKSCDEAQARVFSLHHAIAESGVDKEKVEAALKAHLYAPERLRKLLNVGEDLPGDVAAALALQAEQRDAVNSLFKKEAAEMYAALRSIAADHPSIAVPAEDGPGLFMALNNNFSKIKDLNPRVFDSLKAIRRRTLDDSRGFLDAAQQARLKELIGGNYGFGSARYEFREPSSD